MRPIPNEITLCTSWMMVADAAFDLTSKGVSSRTAMLPQPISKPTPEMLICFS